MQDIRSSYSPEQKMNHQPPYSMVLAVSGSGVWSSQTNGIFVGEIRNSGIGNLVVRTENNASFVTIPVDNYDVLRLSVTHIDIDASTATGITVQGYPLHV